MDTGTCTDRCGHCLMAVREVGGLLVISEAVWKRGDQLHSRDYCPASDDHQHEVQAEVMHGEPAEFRVSHPDPAEEIASLVCEGHLAEAVRAVNVDFGVEAAVEILSLLTNRDDDGKCQWAGEENAYKQAVAERNTF